MRGHGYRTRGSLKSSTRGGDVADLGVAFRSFPSSLCPLASFRSARLSVRQALPTRQFLLTNSELDKRTGFIRFRIPLDILSEHIPDIGDFPHAFDPNNNGASSSKAEARWDGPTLFIKGEHSKYINTRNWTACQSLFPNARLEKLDTGHWTHAEKPQEYVEMVERFVKGVGK